MKSALTAALLITPKEHIPEPVVVIEDGRILQATSRAAAEIPTGARLLDFPDTVLAPGFIDIHIHGAAGCDVMYAGADGLQGMERFLVGSGVTSYFPTTMTAALESTCAALERLATAIETVPQRVLAGGLRAQPLGIHLEGPFISHAKRGVHPPEHLQAPNLQTFEQLWRAARGRISFMTIAPELSNAVALIEEASRRGVCVNLGHSDSDLASVQSAVAAGARHATHTFNAMRALDHREPGILGAILTDDRLSADIIADGIHVHPDIVDLFLRAKGLERAVLITDAISATGKGDGRFRLGGLEVEVRGQRCQYQGRLSGSVLTLDRAVRNVMEFAHWKLQDAVRLATLNPARVAGISGRKGIIAPDADADIVVLTRSGQVIQTMVGGCPNV
ncbi:MAG TPA: N-acetylglucosamine-6-phosphate deacetylase [Terriglobales bacterium]|nr:N-acetylglucosamine-6-phosphate deacetylase [Terriglobales bacterium]